MEWTAKDQAEAKERLARMSRRPALSEKNRNGIIAFFLTLAVLLAFPIYLALHH